MKKFSRAPGIALWAAGILFISMAGLALAQGTAPAGAATAAVTPTPSPKPTASSTQTPTQTSTTTPSQPPTQTPTISPAAIAVVKDVYKLGHETNEAHDNDRNRAGIGDSIIVVVENLKSLVDRADCLDEKGQPRPGCQAQKIGLFLDGIKIEKLSAEAINVQSGSGALRFHLERTADSDHSWADILGAPPLGQGFFEKETSVSVGLNNESPIPVQALNKLRLVRVHSGWFIGCFIGVMVLIYYLWRLANESDLLRDFGPAPEGEGARKPFSLARCQMAFWFIMVIAAFLFIWLVTNAFDIITPSTLALIGIGSGTALGAAAIEVSKDQGAQPKARKSEGFLRDILNDPSGGVSFHRFQMFVWTIVLGLLFLFSVWRRLSMPDFGSTLLALQGISAGTYLGFKIPEGKTSA